MMKTIIKIAISFGALLSIFGALLSITSCVADSAHLSIKKELEEYKYWVVSTISDKETGTVYAHRMFCFKKNVLFVYEEKEQGSGFEIKEHYLDSKGHSLEDCYLEKNRENYVVESTIGADAWIYSESVLDGDIYGIVPGESGNDVYLEYSTFYGQYRWHGFKDVH